jgi:hypothetical protein
VKVPHFIGAAIVQISNSEEKMDFVILKVSASRLAAKRPQRYGFGVASGGGASLCEILRASDSFRSTNAQAHTIIFALLHEIQ